MLPAVAPDNQLADLDRLCVCDVPLFKPHSVSTKHDKLSVRRERSRTRIDYRNLKSDFQRLALDHCDREVVLGQKVCAVLADCEMRDVAPELRREFFLPQQARKLFLDVAFTKRYDVRLPLEILLGRIRASIITTRRRKLLG